MSADPHDHPHHRDKQSLIRRITNTLLAGLAAIIPLVGTIWLLVIIYRILLKVGENIIFATVRSLDYLRTLGTTLPPENLWEDALPSAKAPVWFLIPIVLLLILGAAVTRGPGRAILNWLDRAITRLPLLGFVYSTLKQGVDSFRNLGGSRKFKGVAYIEYPSPGCRLMGFITGNFLDPVTKQNVSSVFIPTSPNPMTGFVVLVNEDQLEISDLSVEHASKLILSAGLVAPEATPHNQPHNPTRKKKLPTQINNET